MRFITSSLFLFLFVFTFGSTSSAQQSFIVRLQKNTNPLIFSKLNSVKLKPISKSIGLYLATPEINKTSVAQALSHMQSSPSVVYANPNHKVSPRANISKPNDKDFAKQWSHVLSANNFGIDALTAWSVYGTGGNDKNGNEIVIAIVDGGVDIYHQDLISNMWVNKNEIAGNGKDDDGNGYIDDINGWDVENDSGTILSEEHGTHVSGIMGAQGNNNKNGVGVNWKVKIMYVSMGWSLADTEHTLAAYEYIRKQKELWLTSNGQLGANVVAINSSFGIDLADCTSTEFSQWNDMINHLGESGILSIGATSNLEVNVDKHGDVPTSCKSDYLVAVTNSDNTGNKATGVEWDAVKEPSNENYGAGFGKINIDLAAPGTDIFSTLPNQEFGSNTGTSMATPHVTGSVGYLYSVASPAFLSLAQEHPGQAALAIKEAMLKSVTVRPNIKNLCASGGILNLFAASTQMVNFTAQTYSK